LISAVGTHMNFLGRFYMTIADYYLMFKQDLLTAMNFCQTAVSLAISTGNTMRHSRGLYNFAWAKWRLGDYSAAQMYADESQRLARISGNLYREAEALKMKSMCLYALGDYKQSISICNRARDLLGLCGMSGGDLEHLIMNNLAEVHKLKSEYVEARNIHSGLLQKAPEDQDPYHHALALLNIAEIDVSIGAPQQNVQMNILTARKLFNTRERVTEVMMCETIIADLFLREGNILVAESLLEKCIRSFKVDPQIISYCLERLGDVSCWKVPHYASSWTMVYFVHSLKFNEKVGIHKALQFLGDICLACDDEETAISLFTVALEGFTWMDVHRSRAECMLRLGDIFRGHRDLIKAVEFWEKARPLFERSSQAKQVDNIDEKLAGVGAYVPEQPQKKLAQLSTPSGTVEGLKDNLSDSDELEEVDLDEMKGLGSVVV
jgi:tetratricopeptide (TPR) repeat protein